MMLTYILCAFLHVLLLPYKIHQMHLLYVMEMFVFQQVHVS